MARQRKLPRDALHPIHRRTPHHATHLQPMPSQNTMPRLRHADTRRRPTRHIRWNHPAATQRPTTPTPHKQPDPTHQPRLHLRLPHTQMQMPTLQNSLRRDTQKTTKCTAISHGTLIDTHTYSGTEHMNGTRRTANGTYQEHSEHIDASAPRNVPPPKGGTLRNSNPKPIKTYQQNTHTQIGPTPQ